MEPATIIIAVLGIVIAILFNVVNGRNDAPNTIAIILATRALTPLKAKLLAAACCLIGPFIFSTAIAKTIGTNLVNVSFLTPVLLLTGLCGGIAWMLFCAKLGLPVSSSHALFPSWCAYCTCPVQNLVFPFPHLMRWSEVSLVQELPPAD